MADWFGVLGKGSSAGGGYGRRSMKDDDFEEEDVWSVMKEMGDSSSNSKYPSSGSSFSSAWHLPATASRMIPAAKPAVTNHGGKVQSSAPVNIPDWSKIYGKDSRDILGSWVDDQNGTAYGDGDGHVNGEVNDTDYEEDDIVPPHEWLARKLARSQISSFSVCEGVGRTLKGRDLSKDETGARLRLHQRRFPKRSVLITSMIGQSSGFVTLDHRVFLKSISVGLKEPPLLHKV